MKSNLLSSLLLSLFLTLNFTSAEAGVQYFSPIKIIPKVIYGTDDRFDIYESSDSLMKEISRSAASQILNDNITLLDGIYTVKSRTLADEGICKSEPFSDQMAAANCSGFLVAPDTLVTAGHCVNTLSDCDNSSWVFDFANISSLQTDFKFTKDQVFHCVQILAREKNYVTLNDYAVIKLDREVPGRTPLKYRTSGKAADDAVFTVIGNPSGVPLKIAAAADMRDNSNPIFFSTNSDTYGGNSGSAVIDSRTGIVEGILVRGDKDYTQSDTENCSISVHNDQNGGRGEDATRITNIKILSKK